MNLRPYPHILPICCYSFYVLVNIGHLADNGPLKQWLIRTQTHAYARTHAHTHTNTLASWRQVGISNLYRVFWLPVTVPNSFPAIGVGWMINSSLSPGYPFIFSRIISFFFNAMNFIIFMVVQPSSQPNFRTFPSQTPSLSLPPCHFSKSASLLLICKSVHLYPFLRFHI